MSFDFGNIGAAGGDQTQDTAPADENQNTGGVDNNNGGSSAGLQGLGLFINSGLTQYGDAVKALTGKLEANNAEIQAGNDLLTNIPEGKIGDAAPDAIQRLVTYYNDHVRGQNEAQISYDGGSSDTLTSDEKATLNNVRTQVYAHVNGLAFISKSFETDLQKALHDYALFAEMSTELLASYSAVLNKAADHIGS